MNKVSRPVLWGAGVSWGLVVYCLGPGFCSSEGSLMFGWVGGLFCSYECGSWGSVFPGTQVTPASGQGLEAPGFRLRENGLELIGCRSEL